MGTNRGGTNNASQATVRSPSRRTPERLSPSTKTSCSTLRDADSPRGQLPALGCRKASGRRDVDEVVKSLANDLGVADHRGRAAEDGELPVSHLEAVAVGAMQDVARPAVAKARNVGDLVAQARRHESRRARIESPSSSTTRNGATPSLTTVLTRPAMSETP